jgi:hypothetical protein
MLPEIQAAQLINLLRPVIAFLRKLQQCSRSYKDTITAGYIVGNKEVFIVVFRGYYAKSLVLHSVFIFLQKAPDLKITFVGYYVEIPTQDIKMPAGRRDARCIEQKQHIARRWRFEGNIGLKQS